MGLLTDNKLNVGYDTVNKFQNHDKIAKLSCIWITSLKIDFNLKPKLQLINKPLSEYERDDNFHYLNIPKMKLIPDNCYEPLAVPINATNIINRNE